MNLSDPFGLFPCGPLNGLCARIAVLAMGRLAPAATAAAAASTGLSSPGASRAGAAAATLGGRHGGAAHRARVGEVADELVEAGTEVGVKITITAGGRRLPERAVQVGGGRIRFPDIIAEAPDGSRVFINIGRANKNGTPVAREVRALEDLNGTGIPSLFVPYNKP